MADVMLFTTHEIGDCVRDAFPNASVHEDGERKVINVSLPPTLLLPQGAGVTITTAVSKMRLINIIEELAQNKFSPAEASQALLTYAPLSDVPISQPIQDEQARSCTDAVVKYINNPNEQTLQVVEKLGLAPRQVEHPTEKDIQYFRTIKDSDLTEEGRQFYVTTYGQVCKTMVKEQSAAHVFCRFFATMPHRLTQAVSSLGRAIIHLIGKDRLYPPNAHTILTALTAIAAATAWCGGVVTVVALGVSTSLQILSIAVLIGRIKSNSLSESERATSAIILLIHLLAIPLLLIPGPWGMLASGAAIILAEALFWGDKYLCSKKCSPCEQFELDPRDIAVARKVFEVPEGEEPNPADVDKVYDSKYQWYLNSQRRAEEKGPSPDVEIEKRGVFLLNEAYMALMGHPRTTGTD